MSRTRTGVIAALLVVMSGCGWAYPGFEPSNSNDNSVESTISASNVANLTEQWRAPSVGGSLLVMNGRVYTWVPVAGADDPQLVSYDAGGTKGCTGSPRTC